MAQLVIRKLETTIKEKLQDRARRHGRSMEDEVRAILRGTVQKEARQEESAPAGGLGTEIAALFSKRGLLSDIPELRGSMSLKNRAR